MIRKGRVAGRRPAPFAVQALPDRRADERAADGDLGLGAGSAGNAAVASPTFPACRLLARTQEPVTRILLEAGFQTTNFNRELQRVTGKTPSAGQRICASAH